MQSAPVSKRIIVMGLLWTLVAVNAWILVVQASLIVFAPRGEWHMPGFYRVEVVEVVKDSTGTFTRDVDVTIDGEQETITLPKGDAATLRPHDSLWILDNFYATGIRPAQFRLTPGRLLAEYPEVLLILTLLALLRLRRSRWGIPPPPPVLPEGERNVFRDTFHHRAQRHAQPSPGENPSTSPTDAVE